MYKHDFKIKRGETFSKDITFKADEEVYDLSGYTAKAQIRPSVESETLLQDITCEVYPEEGKVTLQLTPQQTYTIPAGSYYYDLCLTKDEVNTYFLEGRFIISKFVTEPPNVEDNADTNDSEQP
jgi:hypothetical protein